MQFLPKIQGPLSEPEPRWFAVHTRHQHEHAVAASFLSKGLQIFFPSYEALHRWSDRKKRVTLPLFPGYLFFANEIERRSQIVSTPGVNGIVEVGKVPAEIPNSEIAAIRQMIESTLRVEPHPFLNDGDRVRILAGPLQGLEGIVLRKKDALRLVLSIELLGRSAAVEIDGCVVERLSPARPVPQRFASQIKPAYANPR
jgi:transcription antitermination factor NusG